MESVAVLSHIVVDEVFDSEHRLLATEVGGAGAYAAAGASLAGEAGSTLLVSGVGREDKELLDEWCTRRQISTTGLFEVGLHSPRTRIRYFSDGEREETPVFGLEHFESHTPLPRHIPDQARPLSGVYLFHDHERSYWEEVEAFARTFTGPILWEISLDACRIEHRAEVAELLAVVDILSINETEARALSGASRLEDAIAWLQRSATTVLLRRGSQGSLVLAGGAVHVVGTAPTAAVDPTGGGNSYTGAFLACYARSGDLALASRTAAAAASAIVAAPGAPEIDDRSRRRVALAARSVTFESH